MLSKPLNGVIEYTPHMFFVQPNVIARIPNDFLGLSRGLLQRAGRRSGNDAVAFAVLQSILVTGYDLRSVLVEATEQFSRQSGDLWIFPAC